MKPSSLFLTMVVSLVLPACSSEAKKEPAKMPAKGAPSDPGKTAGITTADLVLNRVP